MNSTSGNWPRRGGSFGRHQLRQNGAPPKTTTYANFHEIKLDHLKTEIKNEGKEVEEFKKTFEDPVEDAVVEFSCFYNFTSRQLSMMTIDVSKESLRIMSHEVNCGKIPMKCVWNENVMQIDLSDRHAFDKNFNLTLEYSLNNAIILESKYHFTVSYTKFPNISKVIKLFHQVPYFQTETELKFRQLDQFDPSEEITKIFHQKASVGSVGLR